MQLKIIKLFKLTVFSVTIFASDCRSENHEGKYYPVSANALKAGALAYERFTQSLTKEFENSSRNRNTKSSNTDMENFLAKIENYDVVITEDAVSFSFSFTPKGWYGATILTYDKAQFVFTRQTYSK